MTDLNAGLIVGSARIDENGRTSGGKKGDDTYKEVSFQEFYYHSKGWTLIRAKDPTVAKRLAQAMIEACENDNVGYSQDSHGCSRNYVKKYGSFAQITERINEDCSGLIGGCVYQATGIDVFASGNMYTGNEVEKLKATGLFDIYYTVDHSTCLCDGDILVTKTTGHTVMVVLGRPRTDSKPAPTTKRLQLTLDCWMRSTPSLTANNKILVIPKNAIIDVQSEVDAENRTWAKTTYKNKLGYVSERYTKQV